MTYAGTGGKTFRKRTITLVIAVPVFIAAYTAGWFYIADRLEAKARADMARLDAQGVGVQCENLHMGGYPLRINVVCDSISWQRPSEGMAFRAGKFSSGSPLYAPYSLTNALTGPAFIEFPGISPLEVNWSKFTSNTRLARPFPTEIEIAARDVAVGLRTEPTKTEPLSSLEHMNVQIDGSTGMLKLMGRFAGLKFALQSSATRRARNSMVLQISIFPTRKAFWRRTASLSIKDCVAIPARSIRRSFPCPMVRWFR